MMNRLAPHKRIALRDLARRIDRIAGEINILLIAVALGLALLDTTFFVTQDIIDHLPPVTRITYAAPQAPSR